MEKRPFGNTGLEVSPLGFGGASVGPSAADRRRAARALNRLLDAGVNLIDTAQCYAGSEELIGGAVGHRRDEFVLVSKCGHHEVRADGSMRSRPIGPDDVDQALRRLRTDRLDVMLLHSYDRDVLERGEALEVLARAREAGKICFAGYSGDNETAALAATLPGVDVVETSVSLADQANLRSVLPGARERGLGVVAKRPVANAAWRRVGDSPASYADAHARSYIERLKAMALDPVALGIEGPAETAWAELALRFTIAAPGVHVAIVGTTDPDHVRANVAAAEKGPLPDEVVQTIHDAFSRAETASGETWRGEN